MTRPIVLVGLPGAGKTTVGAVLAKTLGRPFIDADREIERRTGMSIAAIFEKYGEGDFRLLEREAVRELISAHDGVIALGGGAFDDAKTRHLVKQHCLSIWLDVAIEEIDARLRNASDRPLLKLPNRLDSLRSLAEKRRQHYACADIEICEASVQATVDCIVKLGAHRFGP